MTAKSKRALDALVQQGTNAVPLMLSLVRRESSWELRHNGGAEGLIRMGTNALPGLEQALGAPERDERAAAVSILRLVSIERQTKTQATQLLIRAAQREQDDWVRVYAIDALGYTSLPFLSPPDVVCDALRELLDDKLEKARLTAAYSLVKACHSTSPQALSLIVKGLSGNDAEVARECAFALNFIGTNALVILPELTNTLFHMTNRDVADEIMQVLAGLGDPAFPALAAAATVSQTNACFQGALGSVGELAISTRTNLPAIISILTKALSDPAMEIRQSAANSLRRAAVERRDAELCRQVSRLLQPLLKDDNEWVRDDVKRALDEIDSVLLRKQ